MNNNNNQEVKNDNQEIKEQIRCLLSNVYDMQKLRISAGNRLVQSLYIQMGIKPSESPDEAETKFIDKIKKEYKRVSDAFAGGDYRTIKSTIKALSKSKDTNDNLSVIRNEIDYKLIESYMLLLKSEEELVKVLDTYVKEHPLWKEFFEPIKGCGTLMAANCLAYFDIHKAKYVSSLYRYAGLDTVQDEDKDGNKLWLKKKSGVVTSELVKIKQVNDDGTILYEDINDNSEYTGDVVVSQHGRRMGDTEFVEYIDKNGEIKQKRSITYNPILKTKLMGVLTGCLLKAKDPTYSAIYYDYRARLDNKEKTKDYTAGRKNMMAQRYMIKQFLRNLYVSWRTLEGLEVYDSYEVDKLGNKPHKYNEYQHLVATGQIKA